MMKRIALWIVRLEWPMLAVLSPLLFFPNATRKIARGRFIRRTPLDWDVASLVL